MNSRTTIWISSFTVSLLWAASGFANPGDHALMPIPASMDFRAGVLKLGNEVTVSIEGEDDGRIKDAVQRFVDRMASYAGQPMRYASSSTKNAKIWIRCGSKGSPFPNLDDKENYVLQVTPLRAFLNAPTVVGALRGLATLEQLAINNETGIQVPAVSIEDAPRFPWRGLLIDVCRHWQPIEVIKRNLDAMAAVKLNVLHLHLTEDQGFRVESRRFPKLHQMGSDGKYFTRHQLRDIVNYAARRGIRVVPEFDMPGHTTSWLVGHPELAAGPGPFKIERRWGVFDPCFDPTNERLYTFLDDFFEEMSEIFPDKYMHIGGDEVNGVQWKANKKIQAFMKEKGMADLHALQAYFNRRVAAILKKYGKTMIGWDEILGDGLPEKCVIQSWRGTDAMKGALERGFDAILSNGYYLDHQRPASFHYANDPDPNRIGKHAGTGARILGGEACMWAEYVSPETIDSRTWPRMAAIAERLWAPASINNVNAMYQRLERVSQQLDRVGVRHIAHYEPMLKRMLGESASDESAMATLRNLVDVVEPVKFYQRSASGDYTSQTPLTRLVDTARPESRTARAFRLLVQRCIRDRANRTELSRQISSQLAKWQALHEELKKLAMKSEMLKESVSVARNLRAASILGLEMIEKLNQDQPLTASAKAKALETLKGLSVPVAEVDIAILPGIQSLIEAMPTSN